jgi:hypothetical protein
VASVAAERAENNHPSRILFALSVLRIALAVRIAVNAILGGLHRAAHLVGTYTREFLGKGEETKERDSVAH